MRRKWLDCKIEKPSNGKQFKMKTSDVNRKKAMLEVTIKELEKDANKYTIDEVDDMKTLLSKSNAFCKTVKGKKKKEKIANAD